MNSAAWRRVIQLAALVTVAALLGAAAIVAVRASAEVEREREARAVVEAEAAELRAAGHRAERAAQAGRDSALAAAALRVEEAVATARAVAGELRAARLSLPRPGPSATDSVRYWQETANLAIAEADGLQAALAQRDSALVIEAERRLLFEARAVLAESREDSLARSLARVRADLAVATSGAAAGDRCVVPGTFGRVRCPSRAESALGGAVLGAIAVVAVAVAR